MAFVIGLPVAQIILFCLAIGHDPTGLSIAVANHELSDSLLLEQNCPIYKGCNYTMLSCRYLNFLKNRSVTVVSFSISNLHDNDVVITSLYKQSQFSRILRGFRNSMRTTRKRLK